MGMTNEDWKRAYNALKSENEQLKQAYYALKNSATTESPQYRILGYSAGDMPTLKGVEMGTAKDEGYARDICHCLRLRHIGQWFGYSIISNGEERYSLPMRVTEEKSNS